MRLKLVVFERCERIVAADGAAHLIPRRRTLLRRFHRFASLCIFIHRLAALGELHQIAVEAEIDDAANRGRKKGDCTFFKIYFEKPARLTKFATSWLKHDILMKKAS